MIKWIEFSGIIFFGLLIKWSPNFLQEKLYKNVKKMSTFLKG